jgi:hypothetical protein
VRAGAGQGRKSLVTAAWAAAAAATVPVVSITVAAGQGAKSAAIAAAIVGRSAGAVLSPALGGDQFDEVE